MSLPSYRATRFIRPMERGLNRPFLVRAEDEQGEASLFVVKSRAGFADRPEHAAIDCLATLLARAVGLVTPEPALVELTNNLAYGAIEHPEYADLISSSVGKNYATHHLGKDWKPWIAEAPPRSISNTDMDSVFSFDGMIQNGDREPENPNMQWKGDQLAILDHDKAFGYVNTYRAEQRPWRQFLQLRVLRRHCFYEPGKRHAEHAPTEFGKVLWENAEEARLEGRIREAFATLEGAATHLAIDLDPVRDYFDRLLDEISDFFDYLKATL